MWLNKDATVFFRKSVVLFAMGGVLWRSKRPLWWPIRSGWCGQPNGASMLGTLTMDKAFHTMMPHTIGHPLAPPCLVAVGHFHKLRPKVNTPALICSSLDHSYLYSMSMDWYGKVEKTFANIVLLKVCIYVTFFIRLVINVFTVIKKM